SHLAPSQRARLASALVKSLGHYTEYISQAAADVLVELHRTRAAAVIEPGSDVLRTGGGVFPPPGGEGMGGGGRGGRAAPPPLWDMLGDSDRKVRTVAAAAVWQIEGRTEAVETVLREGLHSDRDEDQSATLAVVRDLAPAGAELLPDVVDVWKQDNGRL